MQRSVADRARPAARAGSVPSPMSSTDDARALGNPEMVDGVLDLMEVNLRNVPGFRRAHARGASFRGHFTATPDGAALSRAEHLQGDRIETVVRLSNGSPCPYDADRSSPKNGAPMGIGVRFELPSGGNAALAALSLPAFGPRDAHDFLAIVKAQKPVMKGNRPNPLALLAFAVRRLYAIPGLKAVATHPTRASFATTRFNGLHAFFAVDASGAQRAFRFRLMPLAGIVPMDPAEHRLLPPQYLISELKTRLRDGPAEWDLVFQLGEPGDRTDDVTKQWPEDRRQVTVGRLVVDRVHEDQDAADRLVYDPTNVPPGIELPDDPLLHFRSHAYGGSFERRTSERKPEVVPE